MSAAPRLEMDLTAEQLLENYLDRGVIYQCQDSSPLVTSDTKLIESLKASKDILFTDPFSLFGPGDNLYKTKLTSLKDKNVVMDHLRNQHFADLKQSLMEETLACIDEIITNAIFNAPFSAPVDRQVKDLLLPNGDFVELGVANSADEVFVMCVDPYGTLKVDEYLRKILNCYKNGVGESINYGAGGAGIGSYIVFDSSSSMIVGVKSKQKTIVGCKFPKNLSSKKRKTSSKNLIVVKGEA